jgi:sugar phosphate isomerase/epimerase
MSAVDVLSIQLYSLRDYADLPRQLDELAAIGFRNVETVGGHLADARETRRLLDASGLAAPTSHVGLSELRSRLHSVLDAAAAIGIRELFMPAVPAEARTGSPPDYWRRLGAELGRIADHAAVHGIGLGYHNHNWELAPYPDGSQPLSILFEAARGSRLTFQADVAWMARDGVDPVEWLERYKDILTSVHVKDLAHPGENADEGGWANIGAGVLDWPTLWREARARGARVMVLEHDKPRDAMAFARESFAAVAGFE